MISRYNNACLKTFEYTFIMSRQRYIGLMSGTSMDGVDAVLIQMENNRWLAAEAHAFLPYSDELKQDLLDLQQTGDNELHRSQLLSQQLSHLYAETVHLLLADTGLNPADIRAIGCHGQTIRHAPQTGYSIQIGNLALLAELTGIFTIGDFRSRDLAAGGQGAPLVPAFHQALFGDSSQTRVTLNLGGIANISVLPPHAPAFGFDTGPGNMLMDAWVKHIWQLDFDADGARAAQGSRISSLLDTLLAHPYFSLPAPKSTGRELFSLTWLQAYLNPQWQPHDILRTLLDYTAISAARAITEYAPQAEAVYVCGGGIRNRLLMDTLQQQLSAPLRSTAALQLDPQWVEAAAFGWLAACWINGIHSNPVRATGARHPCVLGAGYYA